MKLAAMLGIALLLALGAGAPALAVDEGVPDRDGHPNVGLLGFDTDAGGESPPGFLCTGFVISDRAFLTAAHCIAAMPPSVQWVASLESGSPASPVATPGVFPDDFPFPLLTTAKRSTEVVVHPRFGGPERLTHDVAVVLFPAGTFAGVTPVRLPRAGLLDRLARRAEPRRRHFRLVGYGTDPERGNGAPQFVFEGYRQTATARLRALTARQLVLKSGGRGGLCLGDSGSPQLLGDSDVAVSLFSDPGERCHIMRSQRLDTRSELRFLSPYAEPR